MPSVGRMFRAAATVPPIVLFDPATVMPPYVWPMTAVPVGFESIKLPATRLLLVRTIA